MPTRVEQGRRSVRGARRAPVAIRRARRSDRRGVLAAVRTIWGGHDRVPGLFSRWVTHRTGPFFVATVGERVVGMGKLTVLSPRVGWLEGGRVAPRWRRRGIATALIAHRIAYARERGMQLLRFSTSSDNTAMHRAARNVGFRRIAAFARYEAPAEPGPPPRRAGTAEAAAVRRVLGKFVQSARGWEWGDLTPADLDRAIRNGRVFVAGGRLPGAAAIVVPAHDGWLPVAAIGGRGRAARDLLAGLRAEAARRGLATVSLHLADARLERAAGTAGYRRPWRGKAWLFEKRIARRDGPP